MIDPDLGINIVDLGFVRQVDDRMAVITMTLTSAACPLTSIMEDQIRAELAGLEDVAGFRIEWEWLPPWRPADISASSGGRPGRPRPGGEVSPSRSWPGRTAPAAS